MEQETPGSSLKERVLAKIRGKKKGTLISSTDLTNLILEVGGHDTSRNYIQKQLFDDKVLKPKERGTYVVV